MKERIIHEVLQDMVLYLNNEQLEMLKRTMNCIFEDIEVIKTDKQITQAEKSNQDYMHLFISAKRIEGCSDKTLHYYIKTLQQFFAAVDKDIKRVSTDDLRNYLTNYRMQHSSAMVTIDNIRRILSTFFSWLENEGYIFKSPVRRIKRIKTERVVKETYTDEEVEVMRNNCEKLRDLALIDMFMSTGMRVGEIVLLNRDDINFTERECIVLGKGNKERLVYFDARTKLTLCEYLKNRKDSNPALFVSLRAPFNRIKIGSIEARLRKMGERLEIHKVHPHKFRRTLATMAIDKGMPIEQLQSLLGHERIDTTLQYAMVKQNNVKLAHKRFIS